MNLNFAMLFSKISKYKIVVNGVLCKRFFLKYKLFYTLKYMINAA